MRGMTIIEEFSLPLNKFYVHVKITNKYLKIHVCIDGGMLNTFI